MTLMYVKKCYLTHVAMLQPRLSNNRLDIIETDQSVPVVITPTVPITCPPCSVTLSVSNLIGLTVSSCSVTFDTTDRPMTSRTINIRAVPTAGSNSRLTELSFHPVFTGVAGTGWDGYNVATLPVSVVYIMIYSITYITRRSAKIKQKPNIASVLSN